MLFLNQILPFRYCNFDIFQNADSLRVKLNCREYNIHMTVIKIYYGPYEAHGVITHRIERLKGLLQYLEDNNYNIEVIKVNYLNRLAIEMCERQIFLVNITNFKFNMDWQDDKVCMRALDAIKEAETRMVHADNMLAVRPSEVSTKERQTVSFMEFPEPDDHEVDDELSEIPEDDSKSDES